MIEIPDFAGRPPEPESPYPSRKNFKNHKRVLRTITDRRGGSHSEVAPSREVSRREVLEASG